MIAEGTEVLYVPHHDHHADAFVGAPIWEFVHGREGKTGAPHAPKKHAAGDVADVAVAKVGRWRERDKDGNIVTEAGHVLCPSRPLRFWPAVVVKDTGDGTAVLDIQHPHGHRLIYPAVPSDDAKGLHTFHLPE